MREIIFFAAKHIMGHFKRFFEGTEIFLTPKLSWAKQRTIVGAKRFRPPRKIPRKFKFFSPYTKLIPCTFRIRGSLVFFVPEREREKKERERRESERESKSKREREKESKSKERARARARVREREKRERKKKSEGVNMSKHVGPK